MRSAGSVVLQRCAALACTAIFAADITLLIPLLSLRMAAMGEGSATIGLLGVSAAFGGILSPYVVTRLAASMGLARLALGAMALLSAMPILFKLTEGDVWLWLALSAAHSFGLAAMFIVTEALIIFTSPSTKRGLMLGVYASISAVGTAAGPAVLAVAGTEGWHPYLAAAALPLLGAPLLLAMEAKHGGAVPGEAEGGAKRARISDVAPLMLLPIACVFSYGALEVAVFNLFPVYVSGMGYDDREVAAMLAFFGFGGAVLYPLIGWYASTRRRLQRMLVCACAAFLLGIPLLYWLLPAGASAALFALLAAWGAASGTIYLAGIITVGMRFSGLSLVAARGVYEQGLSVGMLLGPLLAGPAMEILLPPHGLLLAMVFFAAVPMLAYCLSARVGMAE